MALTPKAERHVGEACTRGHKFARGRKPGDLCRCGRTRLCNQCWKAVPLRGFGPRSLKNCRACKQKFSRGGRAEPRRGLPTAGEARYTWVPRSGNAKLGPIPTVLASAESCPPSCSWYGRGCFAEYDVLAWHWRRTTERGITFDELLEHIRALPPGTVWRYATAGDLPGVGLELDIRRLYQLVAVSARTRGFTFTHKPLGRMGDSSRLAEWLAVRRANELGFTINLSADTLKQADELAELGVGPVAVVLPSDAPGPGHGRTAAGPARALFTPAGRRVVLCPYETHGITCADCQLCTVATRKSIVGFRAHGQAKRIVSEVASGKRRLPLATV